jgi:TRAP-type C4-dicarboxylate transport system permease small subunit
MTAYSSIERGMVKLSDWVSWLVLPLSFLLFVQWPLREWLHRGSRDANDLAQWIFGLYVSVALTYATRQGMHLTPNAIAQHYPAAWRRRLLRWAQALVVMPWSLFVLWTATPLTWHAVAQLEAFPDTLNPGYFLLKCGVWLLAALMLMQAALTLWEPPTTSAPSQPPD